MRDFPEGFLFGSSTAAHQVEGGNHNNDWWAWSTRPARRAPSRPATRSTSTTGRRRTSRCSPELGQTRTACRSSGRGSSPSRASSVAAALDHYRRLLGAARRARPEAFVTLHHFTAALVRRARRLGGARRRRALRPLLRARRAAARRPRPVRLHDQRAADRRADGTCEGIFPPGCCNPFQFSARDRQADRRAQRGRPT